MRKMALAKNGVNVELELQVQSGRHFRFEVDDPSEPGKKLTHTATIGLEDDPVPSNLLTMTDAELDADIQSKVDAEAKKFADLVESRRRVAGALQKVS